MRMDNPSRGEEGPAQTLRKQDSASFEGAPQQTLAGSTAGLGWVTLLLISASRVWRGRSDQEPDRVKTLSKRHCLPLVRFLKGQSLPVFGSSRPCLGHRISPLPGLNAALDSSTNRSGPWAPRCLHAGLLLPSCLLAPTRPRGPLAQGSCLLDGPCAHSF